MVKRILDGGKRVYDPANEWMRVSDREDLNILWMRYVGSRRLSEGEELDILNGLKGGLKKGLLYSLYLQSKYWKRVRMVVLKRDNFECTKCRSVYDLNVHHKRYGRIFGEESLEDLQVLCQRCHSRHSKRYDLLAGSSKARIIPCEGNMQLFSALRMRRGEFDARAVSRKIEEDKAVAIIREE